MKRTTRSLLFAFVVSAVLHPVVASRHELIGVRDSSQIRAGLPGLDTSVVLTTTEPTTAAATTTTQAQTSTAENSPTTTANAASSATPSSASSSSAAASGTITHENSSSPSSTQPPPVLTSVVATTATNSAGQVVTSLIEYTTADPSATPSQTSSSDDSSGGGGGGLGTGSIIGLSVAGGIAAIGIILFFVWKFTRKRFTDFDDNEAIKWPELNSHNADVHALPTNATGRAGFGSENDSDINLTRAPSPGGAYANSIAASSVPEMYGAGDPYAVPPLPHLNPSQPYHDEPGAYGQPAGFYDPYRGPVPNTFTDAISDHGAEAIPMTQMARMRSPAPQAAYDMQGRVSPAPQAAVGYTGEGRSGTPNPATLGAGGGPPSQYAYGPR